MKTKKLLLIGAIALVVIGCVLAAGCTSTETATTDDASTDAIVGVWFSEYNDVKSTKIIRADGTGYAFISIADDTVGVYQLTWNKNADGTYAIQWSDGKEYTWTPTSAKDAMTSSAGKTQVKKSLDEAAKNILGVWYRKESDSYRVFNADGSGIYKHDNSTAPFTWKMNDNGKYELAYSGGTWVDGTEAKGKVIEWTYDGDNNAITNSEGIKYVRPTESVAGITLTTFSTEPIVGVWFSDSHEGEKGTHIIMADGTGDSLGSYANGTVKVYKITWKKNADGTYTIAWSDGHERTWTVNSANGNMTSSSGKTQVKKSLDETAKNILGAWYNNDKDFSFVFNADGTGITKHNNGTASFTWKLKDNGKYELTYTDGTWSDGTEAKGEVKEWTYDGDNNVIISSLGIKYIRPSESVKDKITLYS